MDPLRPSRNGLARGERGRKLAWLVCCGLLFSAAPFSAINVEEAYRAIPHRYTPFESRLVRMSAAHAAALQEFFRLLNLAIVERVQAQTWFQSQGKRGVAFPNYQRNTDGLIAQLEALTVPDSLKTARRDVIDALKDQRAYFEEWQSSVRRGELFRYPPGASPHHPRVLSSSQKLRHAYARLLQLYPQETERTKQAFFDHLCALDFI